MFSLRREKFKNAYSAKRGSKFVIVLIAIEFFVMIALLDFDGEVPFVVFIGGGGELVWVRCEGNGDALGDDESKVDISIHSFLFTNCFETPCTISGSLKEN